MLIAVTKKTPQGTLEGLYVIMHINKYVNVIIFKYLLAQVNTHVQRLIHTLTHAPLGCNASSTHVRGNMYHSSLSLLLKQKMFLIVYSCPS